MGVAAIGILLIAASSEAQRASGRGTPEMAVGLVFRDAGQGRPLSSPAYERAVVEAANRWFEPAGLCFFVQGRRAEAPAVHYEEIRERRLSEDAVDVFVVARLERRGRSIAGAGSVGGRSLRVALDRADAGPFTLAHELGHVFGLSHTASGVMFRQSGWWGSQGSMSDAQRTVVRGRMAELRGRIARPGSMCERHSLRDGWEDDEALLHEVDREVSGGRRYRGTLLFGKRHGHGSLRRPNGTGYVGQWRRGIREGQGRWNYDSGSVYEGAWRDGRRHGTGVMRYPEGHRYSGDWRAGSRHGQGEMRYASSAVYRGQWRDGKRHGRGRQLYANGARYDGAWRGDQRTGRGTMRYPDGGRYSGMWREGLRHGRGVMRYARGNRYDGTWRDGERHGTGELRFAGGNRYVGDFRDGQRHGRGELRFVSGNRYVGEFRDGQRHGAGRFRFASGRWLEGRWRRGRRVRVIRRGG